MSASNKKIVFVYGTLKQGQPNHHLLQNSRNGEAKFIDKGQTVEKYPLVVGTRYNIPFLLNERGVGNYIKGEVYTVDTRMLARLDLLEDYPSFYGREELDIKTENNGIITCLVYLLNQFPGGMLKKKFYEEYKNSEEQSYSPRSERTEDIPAKLDLEYTGQ